MLKDVLKKVIDKSGYEIQRKHSLLGYDLEDEANELILRIRPNTMLSRERLVTLYQQVVHCERNDLAGDFVECGVWKGGSVGLMALANLKTGKSRRHIHLYDSFSEICEPDGKVDGARAVEEVRAWSKDGGVSGKLVPVAGFYDLLGGPGTLEGNRELLEKKIGYDPAFLHYHKGWFQDTLPATAKQVSQIAILRLDGDWYASTKVCLDYLYSKVVKDGFVIIDDYGAYDGCRKAVDEFRASQKINGYLHHIDKVARYWNKS